MTKTEYRNLVAGFTKEEKKCRNRLLRASKTGKEPLLFCLICHECSNDDAVSLAAARKAGWQEIDTAEPDNPWATHFGFCPECAVDYGVQESSLFF